MSKLVGQFCRMERTTNKPINLITATFQFIIIAKFLKYPEQEIKKALFKMCQKNTYTGIWQKNYELFSVSSGKYGDLFAQFALKNYSQKPSDILSHLPLHRHHPSSCTCWWDWFNPLELPMCICDPCKTQQLFISWLSKISGIFFFITVGNFFCFLLPLLFWFFQNTERQSLMGSI